MAPIGLAGAALNGLNNQNQGNQQQNQGEEEEQPQEGPAGQDDEPTPNSDDNTQPQLPSDVKEPNNELEQAGNK